VYIVMMPPAPPKPEALEDALVAALERVYLRGVPGATARDVAVNVYGGTGGTRTNSRAHAYTSHPPEDEDQ
jgi:hypothetical protein